MKTIKLLPLVVAGLLVVLMAGCGPAYVNTGGYGRPYYGYGYGNPYGYNRPYGYYRPPVVVRPRYYAPSPRVYGGGGSPNARGGYGGGGGYSGGVGGRSRGPR